MEKKKPNSSFTKGSMKEEQPVGQGRKKPLGCANAI